METIYIDLIDSSEKIPFNMTYGIQRELQPFLLSDDTIFRLLSDIAISDEVLKICLSDRNDKGQIIREFNPATTASPESVNQLLEYIFEFFSKFFLKNQERTLKLSNQLAKISEQSQPS